MTSNTLKIDTWSHCTTPSERNGPPLVAVKVGCFHINPASMRGRRIFLLQMVVLCFVPHAALLIQNCSIMAQLSQTFDSSLFLDAEVNTTLSIGEMILALQEERFLVTRYLFPESSTSDLPNRTTLQDLFIISDKWLDIAPHSLLPETLKLNLYHLREDVISIINIKKKESMKRISIYQQINAILLVYMMKNVKSTRSPLWRQLSACYELVQVIDELSIFLTVATYSLLSEDGEIVFDVKYYLISVLEHLRSVIQYLEVEKIDATPLQDVYSFYTTSSSFSLNTTLKKSVFREINTKYIGSTYNLLDQLKETRAALWATVRESTTIEVWAARRTLVIGISVLGLVICAAPVLVLLLRHTFRTIQAFTESIERSTQQLMAEKQKSDLLLSRMLPMPVLRRLRAQRTVPAEAFDAVTIYFSDIVGFTNIAATSTPMEIINMLNMLYRMFDDRIMQYNVYKVETIGDAYMVVSGLPQRNGTPHLEYTRNRHASEIADMSLSLMCSLEGARVPHRPCDPLLIRAGVNTGPCVAGVVGTTMPRYCLFGDTINTASRMESTGEPMKIHISETTKAALDEIGNYIMESRGEVDVQGKGRMETFWLVGKVGEVVIESPPCLRLEDYDQNVLELLIK